MSKRIAVLCVIASLLALLGGCKKAVSEEDLPEKNWTVTSVEYWVNLSPPRFHAKSYSEDRLSNHAYYYKMDRSTPMIDFKDLISIPGVQNISSSRNSDEIVISTNGSLPTGDAVILYYNTYFYEYDYGSGGTVDPGSWDAKIRIITPTVPATINTAK